VFKFPTVDASGNKYVAGVGVDISERRRAEEALAQQAQREAMIHRISQAIRCSLDSHEIYQTAVRELGAYLAVDRCSLFMRDERGKRAMNVADIALAKAVADQTGIAIRQAELYQKAESTSIREALVNRLTMAIRASLSLPEVLSTATRELGRALSASRVHLFLYNSEEFGSPLEHEYLADDAKSVRPLELGHNDPIGRRLLTSSQPLIIDDALGYDDVPTALSDYLRAHSQRPRLRAQVHYPL